MARSTSGLSVNSLSGQPVIPLGQTTVLTSDELDRIRKTLLHTDFKTQGQNLQSEVIFDCPAFVRLTYITGRKTPR
eukprot:748400-Hanusia_phi.AAC.5